MKTSGLPEQQPEEPGRPRHRGRLLRIMFGIAAGIVAVVILAVAALAIVLRTAWFHDYALAKAQSVASEQLGAQVRLQNLALHLSTLSVDIYGLTVEGAGKHPDPPLLEVQHAEAGVGIISLLGRKWYLSSFIVDRPVVRVVVDEKGNSNLPKPKSAGGGSHTSVFDLGIRHASLTDGVAYYNDRRQAMAADLHNVNFHAVFDPLLQKYSGDLSYTGGHLTAAGLQTIPHSLDASFSATPSVFELTRAALSSGKSQLILSATVRNYGDPDVQAQYQLAIDGGDLRRTLHNPSMPAGLVNASGSLHYHAIANRPFLDGVLLNGSLSSSQLDLETPSLRARVTGLAGQYSLAGGDATISSLRARLLGGEVVATAKMTAIGGDSHGQATAKLNGISLQSARAMLRSRTLPKDIVLSGTLNSQMKAAWGKTLDNLIVHADASVAGKISNPRAPGGAQTAVSVNSAIHGSYRQAAGEISLVQSYLRLPQSSLTMNGVMSRRSNVALKFQSGDLHELEAAADLFRTPGPDGKVSPIGLSGTAAFNGTLSGSMSAPHLAGSLTGANLQLHGTAWRSIRAGVDLSPSMAKLENAQLAPASQGSLTLDASAGLSHWSFLKTSPIEAQIHASQLKVTDLTKAIGTDLPVAGILTVNVNVHGTELRPAGQGDISISHATAYNEPIQSLNLNFSGNGDQVNGKLAASLPAGNLDCDVTLRPQEKSYTAQLSANNIQVAKFQAVATRSMDVSGAVTLHATGQGTFDNPQMQATLEASQLTVRSQAITGLHLQMDLANHVASAELSSQVAHTAVHANAKVALTGDYNVDAAFDTQAIQLQPLAAIYAPEQASNIGGETEVHATVHGPLKQKKLLQAQIRIPELKLSYSNTIQLAAASPIEADYRNGVITLQRSAIRGTDTDLQFQGSIPTVAGQPLSLLLLGTVDLRIAQLFDPDLKSSGQLKFNINSTGKAQDIAGQVHIVNANFSSSDLPVGLENGNGTLTLTSDRLVISEFQGKVGGGTVSAQGGITYRPNLQFNLGAAANGIRILYPQGVRESVNANLRLVGTTEDAILGGSVDLSDLSFTPAFDLNNFISQFSGGVEAPPSAGLTQNVRLNISVHSSNNLDLVSKTLSINGAANLQVVGTAAQPVILGRVNLNNGDLIFNGDRFLLSGGTIQFVNPSETEPVVNVALNTTVQQYTIYLRFNGPVDQLRTNYTSNPALPAADIINLLAFGQTTEANTANAAAPANQAAESLLASQVSSQVTSRVSKVAGISQLSINPVLAGGTTQGPPGANLTIQQRVSGNLFVTFSTNLASTQNQTIMGQYQLSPRVAVSATRDQNGGFALDTTIKKTW
ncbi:MAG TPA: translocation/assembly module TamB domain-containing protein [Acidobacteriaceae bacterium]|nr:translocation/assembly module TamB domain-containing protein [Acidobacteriaceae bacterium]